MSEGKKHYWVPSQGLMWLYENDRPADAVELSCEAAQAILDHREAEAVHHEDEMQAWHCGQRDLTSPEIARLAAGAERVEIGDGREASEVGKWPMTLGDAVQVLNEHEHAGYSDWEVGVFVTTKGVLDQARFDPEPYVGSPGGRMAIHVTPAVYAAAAIKAHASTKAVG